MEKKMKYDLIENIIDAIMNEEPLLIVEGIDDISFYRELSEQSKISADIRAVETIDIPDETTGEIERGEGCEFILKAIKVAEKMYISDKRVKNYFLGLIDKDIRDFRREVLGIEFNSELLYITKYYSYESYFITEKNIKKIICELSYIDSKFNDDTVITFIKNESEDIFSKLYYFSLEALRNAIDDEYEGELGYKHIKDEVFKEGRLLHDEKLYQRVINKKESLDEFAESKSLSISDLKKFAKGKWILHFWAHIFDTKLKLLKNACIENKITQCQMCLAGKPDKCLYRVRAQYNSGIIESYLLNSYDFDEKKDILDRLSVLKH
jgi:hypothetical protein